MSDDFSKQVADIFGEETLRQKNNFSNRSKFIKEVELIISTNIEPVFDTVLRVHNDHKHVAKISVRTEHPREGESETHVIGLYITHHNGSEDSLVFSFRSETKQGEHRTLIGNKVIKEGKLPVLQFTKDIVEGVTSNFLTLAFNHTQQRTPPSLSSEPTDGYRKGI